MDSTASERGRRLRNFRAQARWLMAELVIVVMGVLIAISIDAWRQGVQDRRDERVLVESLHREFTANRTALVDQLEVYGRRAAAAQQLLDLGVAAEQLPADSLTTLWQWITRAGSYDPATGVLSASTSSGDIGLIEDLELRSAIAQWPSAVQNMAGVENAIGNVIMGQMMPWLRSQTALPPSGFGELGWPSGSHPTDTGRLLSSVVFENLLREELAWDWVIERDAAYMLSDLDSILAMLEAHLTED